MSEEDRKLQKHLVDEMMKVSESNPDVMFYMESLMKKYEELEQKVEQLESIIKEAIEYINHATIGADSSPIEDSWLYDLYETKHILNKGDNK